MVKKIKQIWLSLKKHKKLAVFLLIVLIVGFVIYKKVNKNDEMQEQQLQIEVVDKGNVVKSVKFVGDVEMRTEQKLRFNQVGKITSVNFAEGDSVKKDDLIATMDNVTAMNEIKRAQIDLEDAQKNYKDTYDDKKDEKHNLKNRINRLEDQKDVLKQELRELIDDSEDESIIEAKKNEINEIEDEIDDAEDELDDMDEIDELYNVQNAKNLIEIQNSNLIDAKKGLENYELRAPFDGVIRKIDLKVGDNLVADDEKYVYIEDPGSLEIVAGVNQSDVIYLKEGQAAEISFSVIEDKIFTGKLIDVDKRPQTSETNSKLYYPVRISIDESDERILPGMKVRVSVVVDERENVLRVPSIAVKNSQEKYYITKPSNQEGVPGETQTVEVGLRGNEYTEIVSGVEEGDEIVAFNFTKLEEMNNYEMENGGELPPDDEF